MQIRAQWAKGCAISREEKTWKSGSTGATKTMAFAGTCRSPIEAIPSPPTLTLLWDFGNYKSRFPALLQLPLPTGS